MLKGNCEPLGGCWVPNLCSLDEQKVFLSTEPSNPSIKCFYRTHTSRIARLGLSSELSCCVSIVLGSSCTQLGPAVMWVLGIHVCRKHFSNSSPSGDFPLRISVPRRNVVLSMHSAPLSNLICFLSVSVDVWVYCHSRSSVF